MQSINRYFSDHYRLFLWRWPNEERFLVYIVPYDQPLEYLGSCLVFPFRRNKDRLLLKGAWQMEHFKNNEPSGDALYRTKLHLNSRKANFLLDFRLNPEKTIRRYALEKTENLLQKPKVSILANYGEKERNWPIRGFLQGVAIFNNDIWSLWSDEKGETVGWLEEKSTKVAKRRKLKENTVFNGKVGDLYRIEEAVRANVIEGFGL